MSNQTITRLGGTLRIAASVFLASLLALFYPATILTLRAQTPTTPRASAPAGGPKEGIKVHGHWTIEVRNPDGKLVTRREFENGLTLSGNEFLAKLLGRQQTPGLWAVTLGSRSNFFPCERLVAGGPASPDPCYIVEASHPPTAKNIFKTLTLSLPRSGGLVQGFVLSGTATAARVGTIDYVDTLNNTCSPDIGPQACPSSITTGVFDFTSKQLSQPVNGSCPDPACAVNVVAGQIIQVTVTISFS